MDNFCYIYAVSYTHLDVYKRQGMQVMQVLGNNMAFFINCKNVAMKMGINMPEEPEFVFTNFIR